jgi:glucose-6-phosphate 1-dehydrogenase
MSDAPSRAGVPVHQVDPCSIIIFGASGDLTKRKLIPAIAGLIRDGFLPKNFCLMGTGRSEVPRDEFRRIAREGVQKYVEGGAVSESDLERLIAATDFCSADMAKGGAEKLGAALDKLEKENGVSGNRLFYFSLPPTTYAATVHALVKGGVLKRGGSDGNWHRCIVEKPFGTSGEGAAALNAELLSVLSEKQIYRIDHYLGKDTVQNLLVMRFANSIFEPIWNRQYIDHVQITVAEEIGVDGRGQYYEEAGALRDMFQNHILQVLCLTAMEAPINFTADAVRDEKVKVLRALRTWKNSQHVLDSTARGQYAPGTVRGEQVPSYRQEKNCKPNSNRETFAAVKFMIDNWRWQDVPFYLRSGKRMPARVSEIYVQFKQVPHLMFQAVDREHMTPNSMVIRVQPDEKITLQFQAKIPGVEMKMKHIKLSFDYQKGFDVKIPSAYQTLILNSLQGDATLFTRKDEIEAQWATIDPILKAWETSKAPNFPNYDPASWGPSKSDELLAKDGREWHNPIE